MNFPRTQRAAAAAVLCLMLAACGGGGGSDNDPAALPATLNVTLPSSVDPGQALALSTNAESAVGLSYAWDFGDGTKSADAAPSHSWAAAGVYKVTVVVTNNAGEQRSFTADVTVGHLANVAGLVCSEANDAGWCWQRPLPTGNPVNAVAMLDAQTGWAVGEQGTLLKTTDGGATWKPVAGPSTAALGDVAFADAQHGWALASDGSVWRTTDGGATWTAIALNPDISAYFTVGSRLQVVDANRVLFGNGAAGVASSDGGLTWQRTALNVDAKTPNGTLYSTSGGMTGELARSTDFGKTFQTVVAVPSTSSGYVSSAKVSFSDDLNGWLITNGYDYATGWVWRLWRTADGGNSWTEAAVNGLPMYDYPSGLKMSGDTGWFWSSSGVYRTNDGGAHWAIASPPNAYYAASVNVIDMSTVVVLASPGAFLTTDGGATWTSITPPDEVDTGWGLAFTPTFQQVGNTWVMQYASRVYRTTDHGATWERVLGGAPDETNTLLRSLWFSDANQGWAASSGGKLLRTTDGGRSWTQNDLSTLKRGGIGGFQFIDAANGWVLLGTDTFARTTDGGATWSIPLAPSTFSGLTTFRFLDVNRGWVVGTSDYGYKGVVWRTTDGGGTWSSAALPNTNTSALDFGDANTGLVVTYDGRIARTTDGGATWQMVAPGVVQSFYGVRFTSPTEAWIVGSNGTLLHSTDAGSTWKTVAVQMQTRLRDIRFADAKNGWVVGDGGTVLATRDGGVTWSVQPTGTARDLHSVFAVDSATAWIGGADGLVLSTAFGGGR